VTVPQLEEPPVIEVICGVMFRPLDGLTPVLVGRYWAERADEFPRHLLQPALSDGPVLSPVLPIRVWLVSSDDVFIIQAQQDRFYLNWRLRGGRYPRFRDPSPDERGILSRTLEEFDRFCAFCRTHLRDAPQLTRIELAKVDHLVEGKHWRGLADLVKVVPTLESPLRAARTDHPTCALQLFEEGAGAATTLVLSLGAKPPDAPRTLAIETRTARTISGDLSLRDAFSAANAELNLLFFEKLIAPSEWSRFGGRT
jgi:uncharacterized protein (TIGR04255 family)